MNSCCSGKAPFSQDHVLLVTLTTWLILYVCMCHCSLAYWRTIVSNLAFVLIGHSRLTFHFSLCFINRVVFHLLNLLSSHFCLMRFSMSFHFCLSFLFQLPLFCLLCGFGFLWSWGIILGIEMQTKKSIVMVVKVTVELKVHILIFLSQRQRENDFTLFVLKLQERGC